MEMRLTKKTDNKREKQKKSTPFAVITFLRALCPFLQQHCDL